MQARSQTPSREGREGMTRLKELCGAACHLADEARHMDAGMLIGAGIGFDRPVTCRISAMLLVQRTVDEGPRLDPQDTQC